MYVYHYNLVKKPFEITTDPRYLWLGDKHDEALATLEYGVRAQKGLVLLSGDAGTGKTTLINALLETLNDDTLVANITDPELNVLGFFNLISQSFNLTQTFGKKEDFLASFSYFLRRAYSNNKVVLLIIDEAHRLSKELLEQIRLLSNIELPEKKLLNIFFVGQNELNQTLTSEECRALRQRIVLAYQIKPLSKSETLQYIRYRLKVAGTEKELFDRTAIREIYRFSSGYPRLINIICDHALLTGYVRELTKITPEIVRECSQDLRLPGEPRERVKKISHVLARCLPTEGYKAFRIRFGDHMLNFGNSIYRGTRRISFLFGEYFHKGLTQLRYHFAEQSNGEDSRASRSRQIILGIKRIKPLALTAAASAVVTATAITLSSQKDVSPRSDQQKIGDRVITSPATSPVESGRDHTLLPHPEKAVTGALDRPAKVQLPLKPEPTKPNALELATKALKEERFASAVELFEEAVAQNPADVHKVNVLYAQALQRQADLLIEKEPDKAEVLLRKAAEADPHNATVHFRLGKIYTASKDHPNALRAYQIAADIDSRSPDTLFNLGFAYAATKDYRSAEQVFFRVTELQPQYLDKALFNLATVQQKQGKKEQCIENLKKALMVNPENRRARRYLDQFRSDLGESR